MDEALYACRFVQFTAAMLLFGTAAFRIYALAGSDDRAASNMLSRFDACFGQLLLIASVIALISAITLLQCQAAEMTGSSAAAMDLTAVGAVLLDTRFGRVWRWHLLLAAILVLVCLYRQPKRPVVLILSLGLEINQNYQMLGSACNAPTVRRFRSISGISSLTGRLSA